MAVAVSPQCDERRCDTGITGKVTAVAGGGKWMKQQGIIAPE